MIQLYTRPRPEVSANVHIQNGHGKKYPNTNVYAQKCPDTKIIRRKYSLQSLLT